MCVLIGVGLRWDRVALPSLGLGDLAFPIPEITAILAILSPLPHPSTRIQKDLTEVIPMHFKLA
jgi:hypothetical protein